MSIPGSRTHPRALKYLFKKFCIGESGDSAEAETREATGAAVGTEAATGDAATEGAAREGTAAGGAAAGGAAAGAALTAGGAVAGAALTAGGAAAGAALAAAASAGMAGSSETEDIAFSVCERGTKGARTATGA